MVGSSIAMPLGYIETALGNKNEEIIIRNQDTELILDKIELKVIKEEAIKIKRAIVDGIVAELRSLPPSKSFWLSRHTKDMETSGSLRQQIIDAIERDNSSLEPLAKRMGDNEFHMTIKIDHPLAYALNYGTGIYNEENPHLITAVQKRYMFIPGEKFMASYYAKKASKMGYNREGMHVG